MWARKNKTVRTFRSAVAQESPGTHPEWSDLERKPDGSLVSPYMQAEDKKRMLIVGNEGLASGVTPCSPGPPRFYLQLRTPLTSCLSWPWKQAVFHLSISGPSFTCIASTWFAESWLFPDVGTLRVPSPWNTGERRGVRGINLLILSFFHQADEAKVACDKWSQCHSQEMPLVSHLHVCNLRHSSRKPWTHWIDLCHFPVFWSQINP